MSGNVTALVGLHVTAPRDHRGGQRRHLPTNPRLDISYLQGYLAHKKTPTPLGPP